MANEALGILDEDEELSLLETLDHVLDRGLVIAGEVTIAVADIDLIYVGLHLLLGSVESVNRALGTRERRMELLSAGARRGGETRVVVETGEGLGDSTVEG
ncbi:MAG TPA: gas vesicle protein [Pyrinomonadaceae bacterium]|nr:gas vesicle protein [Pyrinomonadaceae bacterium]